MTVTLTDAATPPRDHLIALYAATGWTAYTSDPDTLIRAIAGSLRVVTAWQDDDMVGLARVVGDGASIAYLQDVLVHPDHRRRGIGAALVASAFEPFAHVRQHVLLTDTDHAQRVFYEALGFTEIRDVRPAELRAFVRVSPVGT